MIGITTHGTAQNGFKVRALPTRNSVAARLRPPGEKVRERSGDAPSPDFALAGSRFHFRASLNHG